MADPEEMSLFLAALNRESPEERAAYLDAACAENPALRRSVAELLAAHDLPDNILDERPLSEQPGAQIGAYRLLELIGEGGFGLVFVAQQTAPVKRRVALKIIKPGMDTREVIARFEAERQALAMMDHSHIARVFDAGMTATGRPYFVMELVRGISITEFCERSSLSVPERLELFVDVCQAVQHAHQKGVIHRDLKPSNVLVTQVDGRPVVKVIDFGVAKAIEQPLTDRTIYTRFSQVLGTPMYMSPEQVALSSVDVDTRSDVYALGVLLYELLTGTTPFDRQRFRTASFDEVRRIIRDEDPPRPSTRLTVSGLAGATVVDTRTVDQRTLASALRRDLDWVVMKALDKVRARRYETAAAFAADIQRYLHQEPIEARPPTRWYRFQKFARRNQVALSAAAAVIAALAIGTGVSVWQAIEAQAAKVEADALRAVAVNFADRLRTTSLLLDSARALTDEQRWPEAYEQYQAAAQLLPDHYLVWSGRGALHVRLGLWSDAAADYSRALDLGAPTNNPGWWGISQLLLFAGEERLSRSVARQMWAEARDSSDDALATLAIRASVLSEIPHPDLLSLEERAERLMAGYLAHSFDSGSRQEVGHSDDGPQPVPRGEGPPLGFRIPEHVICYTAGLVAYRRGNNDRAVQLLEKSLRLSRGWKAVPMALPVLAMAQAAEGQNNAAAETLADALREYETRTDAMVRAAAGSVPFPWFDWVEFQETLNEATRHLTGHPRARDPRVEAIEARARAAL